MSNVRKYNWYYVYCLENKNNGKRYVGWSPYPYKRFKYHTYLAKSGSTSLVHKAMRKYGDSTDVWDLTILDKLKTARCAIHAESLWIATLKTNAFRHGHNGYNMTDGGEGSAGRKHSQEAKDKISKSRKESGIARGKNNPMYGQGYKILGSKNHFYGKHHSEKTKRRLSMIKIGSKHSSEAKAKMTTAKIGKPCPWNATDNNLVKRMQKMYNEDGKTIKDIIEILKGEGVKTKKRLDKWSERALLTIIDNANKNDNIKPYKMRVARSTICLVLFLYQCGFGVTKIINYLNKNNVKYPYTSNMWTRGSIYKIAKYGDLL